MYSRFLVELQVEAKRGLQQLHGHPARLLRCVLRKNTLAAFARLQDRLYEVATLDLLSAPVESDGNSYIAHSLDDNSNSIIAIRESDYRWSFPTYNTNIVTGTVTAGTNTTTQVTSTNIGDLPTFASGRFLIQFLTATNATIRGLPRPVTVSATNTVSWSPALPATVTLGDTFRIYMSNVGVLATPVFSSLTVSGLSTSRVVYTTTGGTLTSSTNLTYDGTTLTLGAGTINTYAATTIVKDTTFQIKGTADATKIVVFSASALSTGTTRTFTLPDVSDTIVTLTASQSLTNKTISGLTLNGTVTDSSTTTFSGSWDAYTATAISLKDTIFTLKNSADNTKLVRISAALVTTGTTRTLSAPDASGTLVLLNAGGLVDPSQGGLPPGTVLSFAGPTLPSGFLLCDGSAVSRTTYSALFSALGTAYGVGNGSTTFNIPDLRGRGIAGKDDMGGVAASRITSAGSGINGGGLAATGGTETVTLTSSTIPSHSHTINDSGHNHTINNPAHAHGVSDPTHAHSVSDPSHAHVGYFGSAGGGTKTGTSAVADTIAGSFPIEASFTGIGIFAAATNISINNATTSISANAVVTGITGTNTTGSGNAHQNMSPTMIMNYIIKI
jgi:microcystin-dependent protein